MTAEALDSPVSSGDRLALALCVAILIHALVLLGVSFTFEKHSAPHYQTMDIILVQQKSKKAPEKTDTLAQANLEGGGHSEKATRPATPFVAPFPARKAAIAPAPPPAPAPPATPVPAPAQFPTEAAPPPAPEAPARAEAVPRPAPKTLAAKTENAKQPLEVVRTARPKPAKPQVTPAQARKPTKPARKAQRVAAQPPAKPAPPLPSAAALITDSFAVASLSAEIDKRLSDEARRPRRKFISAATREYKYAAYMEAWRSKVQRIGNLNYPEKARQEGLSGSLILDVAILPDGSVKDITIRRSSGFKVLDDAAIRIVKLAAPFAPFPPDIAKEVDVLHIVRTWQFLNNYRFSSN